MSLFVIGKQTKTFDELSKKQAETTDWLNNNSVQGIQN